MRLRWFVEKRTRVLRIALTILVSSGLAIFVNNFVDYPASWSFALWGVFVVGAGLAFLGLPLAGEHPLRGLDKPDVTVRKDGSFTWRPAGEPRPGWGWGAGATQWLHGEPRSMRRHEVVLAFELPDETPPRALKRANRDAVREARRVRGPDSVKARGAWRDVPGPMSRVQVKLTLKGHRLDAESTRAAAEAFARAFRARLEHAGVTVTRRR